MMPAITFAQIQIQGWARWTRRLLLEQAKTLVAELTSMKSSGKLDAADTAKVDTMLPKATAVNTGSPSPRSRAEPLDPACAGQLGDLQKQYNSLKGG